MRVYMKYLGGYIGVEPGTTTVYHDRPAGAGWEDIDLVPSKNRTDTDKQGNPLYWTATFVAANLVLSQQPDGSLQTRPAGTDAGYEQIEPTHQPDGQALALRYQYSPLMPLTVLMVEVKS